MRRSPPRSTAARSEWLRTHPWWAGCSFGAAMFVIAMAVELPRTTVRGSVVASAGVAALSVFVFVPFFTLATERHRGDLPDAENSPPTTARRRWTRVSDRALLCVFAVSVGVTVMMTIRLVAERDHRQGAVIGLVCGAWFAATTWAELQHRRHAR